MFRELLLDLNYTRSSMSLTIIIKDPDLENEQTIKDAVRRNPFVIVTTV